jgi:hypothetical protein
MDIGRENALESLVELGNQLQIIIIIQTISNIIIFFKLGEIFGS